MSTGWNYFHLWKPWVVMFPLRNGSEWATTLLNFLLYVRHWFTSSLKVTMAVKRLHLQLWSLSPGPHWLTPTRSHVLYRSIFDVEVLPCCAGVFNEVRPASQAGSARGRVIDKSLKLVGKVWRRCSLPASGDLSFCWIFHRHTDVLLSA